MRIARGEDHILVVQRRRAALFLDAGHLHDVVFDRFRERLEIGRLLNPVFRLWTSGNECASSRKGREQAFFLENSDRLLDRHSRNAELAHQFDRCRYLIAFFPIARPDAVPHHGRHLKVHRRSITVQSKVLQFCHSAYDLSADIETRSRLVRELVVDFYEAPFQKVYTT